MRLIDADAFEKYIEEKYKDGESTDNIKDQMLFDLSYQPTAYDIEELVTEMVMYRRSTRIDANGDKDDEWVNGRYRGALDMADVIKRCFKNDKTCAELMKKLDLLHF